MVLLSSSIQILEDYIYTSNLNELETFWTRHHHCPVALLQHLPLPSFNTGDGDFFLQGTVPSPH